MTASPTLFPELIPVNVSRVPQRSPFRYPGGKTWFVPYLRAWLGSLPVRPRLYLEPFVGGGSLACTVLAENLADQVQIVELDEDVVSVWQTIFSDAAPILAQQISEFDLTADSVDLALERPTPTTLQRAFQTILRNRVNRGGILAPGAGRLKTGENGRGLLSRWYPETLARRILALHAHQERVTVIHGDGLAQLQCLDSPTTASLLDPPYTAGGKGAGSRLYRHSELDHERLFALAAELCGAFLLTYDDAPEVRSMTKRQALNCRAVAMKSTHHAQLTELVIGRDLGWL